MRPPKLTPGQVAEMLTKLSAGASALALGKEYGVSDQTVYRCARLAKERAWELGSAAQMRDGGGEEVAPENPKPLSAAEIAQSQQERYQRALESTVIDPVTGVTAPISESDGTICRNVTRELYKAFRAAGRAKDFRAQAEIAKTIASVVRARHQIAPPKGPRGALKLYAVEASPDVWPDPPKDKADGTS